MEVEEMRTSMMNKVTYLLKTWPCLLQKPHLLFENVRRMLKNAEVEVN